jgi:dTDP-4-dehydrorhamnose reductase
MKLTILLTGKSGQIGAELATLLPRLGEVIALDRHQLDLSKPEEVRRVIRSVKPQLIINASAYTAVDQAENDETSARAINGEAPALMAEEAKKIGAALVHYSTDYVFDGSKNSPYEESDPANPINVYGKTKLAAEQAIRNIGVPHLIFRTQWVYATRGRNFLVTILRLATRREELRIVCDQTGAPTWCREIAAATIRILMPFSEKGLDALSSPQVGGIYHMTAGGATNWYAFAGAILEEASQIPPDTPWFAATTGGQSLVTRRIVPITTQEYPAPAHRPAYAVLSNGRLARSFGLQLPDWRTQLHSAFADNQITIP